jgi:hypothetical protein
MKKYKMKATDGSFVWFLSPETPEEELKLRKLEAAGKISSKASFGDWKEQESEKPTEDKKDA